MSRPRRVDVLIAVGLYAVFLAEIVGGEFETDAALLVASGLAMTLPLAWRRVAPLPAVVASMAGAIVLALLTRNDIDPQTPIVVMLVAAYFAGAHLPRREALAGFGLIVVTILVDEPGDAIVVAPVCLGAWFAGRLWQARERDARRMTELAEALDRERVEEGRIAVSRGARADRARTARRRRARDDDDRARSRRRAPAPPARPAAHRRDAAQHRAHRPAGARRDAPAARRPAPARRRGRRSRRSRVSRASTSSSSTCAAPGWRSICAWSASLPSCPQGST